MVCFGLARVRSALSLLVLRILADDHDVAVALDDLALVADFLHGRFYFHCYDQPFFSIVMASLVKIAYRNMRAAFAAYLLRQVILPLVGS